MSRDDDGLELFQGFMASSKPQIGRLREGQLGFLFGDDAARIRSAAVVPIGESVRYGILAVGSRRQERFTSNMSTEFLSRIGELIAARLG